MTVDSTKVNRQKPYGSTVLSYKVNQGYTLLVGVSDESLRNLNAMYKKVHFCQHCHHRDIFLAELASAVKAQGLARCAFTKQVAASRIFRAQIGLENIYNTFQ